MVKRVFWIAFLVSIAFQEVGLIANPITDETLWTKAAITVQTGDHRTFPALDAYMHPGGPSIEGTIISHTLFKTSYDDSLTVFLVILDSVMIGLICMLCYVLRKNLFWPITVLSLISLQTIYDGTSLFFGLTPPSILVSLALPLLVLLTLYLYEKRDTPRARVLVYWAALAGFSAACRIDAGSIMSLGMLLLLASRYDLKKVFLIAIGAFVAFCAFDPFMWFAPVTQVISLLTAVSHHYAGSGNVFIAPYLFFLMQLSGLSLVSIVLGICFVLLRKDIRSPLPSRFLVYLLSTTALLAVVFLTANSQASRYFTPLLFIWEILLPFFVFSLVSQVQFSFIQTSEGQTKAQNILKTAVFLILLSPLALNFYSTVVTLHILTLF